MPIARGHTGCNITWEVLLDPYVKSQQIYTCPSDSQSRGTSTAPRQSYSVPARTPATGVEYMGPGADTLEGTCSYRPGRSIASIPQTAQTLMVAESPVCSNRYGTNISYVFAARLDAVNSNPTQSRSNDVGSCDSTPSRDGNLDALHLEGWNYLFADGHVKWLRPEATVGTGTLASPRGMWTINEGD